MKHILVVDDEPRIAEIARDYLERAGYRVTVAGNGVDALAIARTRQPDLIVLDLGLPQMDGLDVTRALRRQSNVPIIMLTARVDESDTLIGLELGADDYVTKPFSPKELVARVRAVFRRVDAAPDRGGVIRAGDVTLDKPRMDGQRRRPSHRSHRRPSSSCWRRWPVSRAGCSRGRSCSTPFAARRWNRSTARSTRTSRTCAASSSRIHAIRATC